MSTARKGRARLFAEFEEKPVKGSLNALCFSMGVRLIQWPDFDPENEAPDSDEGSDSEESGDDLAGTEHYVAVG